MYHEQIVEVADIKDSYPWVENSDLKGSTKALIMTAQGQALSTGSTEPGVYHSQQDPSEDYAKVSPRQKEQL